MAPRIIKNDGTHIRYIYHLSDIHIRTTGGDYIAEYKQVFHNLFTYLQSQDTLNSLIVITGDIIHNKCVHSDYSIELLFYFMNSLAAIRDVIVIFGNHDGSIIQKRDGLYHILDKIPGVYYLQMSGEYVYNNIAFGVSSLLDGKMFPAKDIVTPDKMKVALYHGMLKGASLHNNKKISEGIPQKAFDGYDYVLLGDIHKHQYFRRDKSMAYASSLIQQNAGETVDKHGLIKWDMGLRKSEFVEIANSYGYVNLLVENSLIISRPKTIPSKTRVKVICFNTPTDVCHKLVTDLVPECSSLQIEYRHNNISKAKFTNIDLFDDNILIKILEDYCKEADIQNLDKILAIHKLVSQEIKKPTAIKTTIWELITIKFSNLFSYGEYNEIDFSDFSKSVTIIGDIHSGKSSIINIILFGIYGEWTRTCTNIDALNINKNSLTCIVTIRVGTKTYKIVRTAKKLTSTIKLTINVFFYEYDEEMEEYINLTQDSNKETCDLIESHVGTLRSVLNSSFYLQRHNENNFLNLTSANQIEILANHCQVSIIEQYRSHANRQKNCLAKEIAELEKVKQPQHTDQRTILVTRRQTIKKQIDNLWTINNSTPASQEDAQENLLEVVNDIRTELKIANSVPLTKLIQLLEDKIASVNQAQKQYEAELSDLIDTTLLEQQIAQKNNLPSTEIITVELKYIDEILKLVHPITNLPAYRQAHQHYSQLRHEKINQLRLQSGTKTVKQLRDELCARKEYILDLKEKIRECGVSSYNLVTHLENYQTYCESIDNMTTTKDNQLALKQLYAELSQIEVALNNLDRDDDIVREKEAALKKIREQYDLYVSYTNIMSVNGLYAKILDPFIGIIEEKMNDILASISVFKIAVDRGCKQSNKNKDPKYDFDIYKMVGNKRLGVQSLSGSEYFFTSLAFKLALNDVTRLQKPNFFVVDEGLSCMSSNYIGSHLKVITNLIEERCVFSLIIDHNEFIKSIGNKEIVLVKDLQNYASVYNLNKNVKDTIKYSIEKELADMSAEDKEEEVVIDKTLLALPIVMDYGQTENTSKIVVRTK